MILVFRVDVGFDEESQKYFVIHSEIPGLHAEAKSVEELCQVIKDLGPGLKAANGVPFLVQVRALWRGLTMEHPNKPRDGNSAPEIEMNLRLPAMCAA